MIDWLARRAYGLVMGAAFGLPLIVVGGLFVLVMALTDGDSDPAASARPESSPTESTLVVGQWPPHVTFSPHTIPAMIHDEIAVSGEQIGYQFFGQAGDYWALSAESRDGVFDPQMTLYGPSGEKLSSNDDRSPSDPDADLFITLPETGTYRVLVESSESNPTTGAYLFALFPR